MADVFEVADILVSHALRTHRAEIAIIAYYGSYAKGVASSTSDLDIFYIPDEGRATSLSSQFVLDGLPYDFWPVSWRMAEEIANAKSHRPWSVSASLIADTVVLYSRSKVDLDRFDALKARIEELTHPESRAYMVERALDAFKTTLFQLGQMRLAADNDDWASLRWAGWKLAGSAVNCLALINQTYLSKGWGASLSSVLQFREKPADLEEMLRAIVTPGETGSVLEQAERLTRAVRAILIAAQASIAEPAEEKDVFSDFYFYIREYVAKVLSACERRDIIAATSAAFQMQEELCALMNKVESGIYGSDFNLLSEYSGAYERAGFPDLLEPASRGDLATLAGRTCQLDEFATDWFQMHRIERNVLANKEALERFLSQKDPAADPR